MANRAGAAQLGLAARYRAAEQGLPLRALVTAPEVGQRLAAYAAREEALQQMRRAGVLDGLS